MADRYDDRYRTDEFRGERGQGRHDRGPIDRASDEVRSWFGDDEAERRRRMDYERERARYGSSSERGWGEERWDRGDRWTTDYGRTDYDRPHTPYRRWHEADYASRPAYQYGYGDWFTPGWHPDELSRQSTPSRQSTRTGESRGYYEDYRGRVHQFDHSRSAQFAGRGPKGYRRSDERIREDVCDRLCDNPYVDASEIEVNVRNGEVTLSGNAHSREDKRQSEEIAESVSGVVDVQNNLRVTRWEGSGTTTNPTSVTGAPSPTPVGSSNRR